MTRGHYFVTGTDTEVGKTLISAALLRRAARRGYTTAAFKPVAAGAQATAEGLRNDDALILLGALDRTLAYEVVNPVCLAAPVAPHIAAREQGLRLDMAQLLGHYREFSRVEADFALVEGAGGWRVPLNGEETLADFAAALELPVILVVAMRLGCINHALLSAEAIARDGLRLAGWVANQVTPEPMARHGDNLATLVELIPAPLLGDVPFVAGGDSEAASRALTLPDGLEPGGDGR